MTSKPINICWSKTGFSRRTEKIMSSIELQTIFSTNIKIKIIRLVTVLLDRAFGPSGLTKLVLYYNFSF